MELRNIDMMANDPKIKYNIVLTILYVTLSVIGCSNNSENNEKVNAENCDPWYEYQLDAHIKFVSSENLFPFSELPNAYIEIWDLDVTTEELMGKLYLNPDGSAGGCIKQQDTVGDSDPIVKVFTHDNNKIVDAAVYKNNLAEKVTTFSRSPELPCCKADTLKFTYTVPEDTPNLTKAAFEAYTSATWNNGRTEKIFGFTPNHTEVAICTPEKGVKNNRCNTAFIQNPKDLKNLIVYRAYSKYSHSDFTHEYGHLVHAYKTVSDASSRLAGGPHSMCGVIQPKDKSKLEEVLLNESFANTYALILGPNEKGIYKHAQSSGVFDINIENYCCNYTNLDMCSASTPRIAERVNLPSEISPFQDEGRVAAMLYDLVDNIDDSREVGPKENWDYRGRDTAKDSNSDYVVPKTLLIDALGDKSFRAKSVESYWLVLRDKITDIQQTDSKYLSYAHEIMYYNYSPYLHLKNLTGKCTKYDSDTGSCSEVEIQYSLWNYNNTYSCQVNIDNPLQRKDIKKSTGAVKFPITDESARAVIGGMQCSKKTGSAYYIDYNINIAW